MLKNYFWIIVLLFIFQQGTNATNVCKSRGRFPNNLQSDCRGYTMCLIGADGFTNYDLLCPEHSIYSHLDNQCTNVTSYLCSHDYNCIEVGNFVNPSSENCSSYFACVKDLNNITTARLISCQPNEFFDVAEAVCVNGNLTNCNLQVESPKVLHVSVNSFSDGTANVSIVNRAAGLSTTLYSTITAFIVLIIVLK